MTASKLNCLDKLCMWSSQGSLINTLWTGHHLLIFLIWFLDRHMSFAYIRDQPHNSQDHMIAVEWIENPVKDVQISITASCSVCLCLYLCMWKSEGRECKSDNATSFSQICITNSVPVELAFAGQVAPHSFMCWVPRLCLDLHWSQSFCLINHLIKCESGLLSPDRRTENRKNPCSSETNFSVSAGRFAGLFFHIQWF